MKMQTTKMLGIALYTAAIATMLGLPASAGQAPMAALQLKTSAAPKRAEVAKQNRLRAGVVDTEAAKLDRWFGAMANKWPAMANSRQQGNVTTAQARRSVTESR